MTTQKEGVWFLWLGISLIIVGILAIAAPHVATFASILVMGWLLILGGIARFVFAWLMREHEFFQVLSILGLFTILVGILFVIYPKIAMYSITMLLAFFLLAMGIFRIYIAAVLRFENWGWFLTSGVIAFIFGVLILVHWPAAALWVFGLYIGIDFVATGWSLVMTALQAQHSKS